MNRRFLLICLTLGLALLLIAWASVSPYAATASADAAQVEAVQAGQRVWLAQACAACHALLGQGSRFAPDLTRIHAQRDLSRLRQSLQSADHPSLNPAETEAILSLLQVASQLSQGAQP